MRVLFTSTQGSGHYQPLVPFIEGCRRLGHEIHVVVPPALDGTLAASGYGYTLGADPPPEELGPLWASLPGMSFEEAERTVLCELFGRLKTTAMLPAARELAASFAPHLIVREAQEYAGAVAAEEVGVPHVRVAVSLARLEALSMRAAGTVLERLRPGVAERIATSPYLSCFPASLDPATFDQVTRVHDHAAQAPGELLPDAWPDPDAPLVYVTFGSVFGGMAESAVSYGVVLEALAELPVRVLLTTGHAIDPVALGSLPANVHAERWRPQADVLTQAAVVVCHGGSGTMLGALGAGVPLVIVPLFADQPYNAAAVASAGAGIAIEAVEGAAGAVRVLTQEGDAARIADAVATVLADPSYRAAAARIAAEQRSVASVDSVLDRLSRG